MCDVDGGCGGCGVIPVTDAVVTVVEMGGLGKSGGSMWIGKVKRGERK